MTFAIQEIKKLNQEAEHCKDPQRLHQIAWELRHYYSRRYLDARKWDTKARELEQAKGE